MAESKQREKDQKQPSFMEKLVQEAEDNQKKKNAENTLRLKKQESDERIEGMIANYIRSEQELGQDHFTTQMYGMFIDLVVPLKELSETMLGMQDAMSTLDSTLGLIDDTMNFMFGVMKQSTRNKYGLGARLKQKRTLGKFIKNNNARMKSIQIAITAMAKTSEGLRRSLGDFSAWMKKNTAKQKMQMTKARVKEAKRNGGEVGIGNAEGIFMSDAAKKLINDRKKAMGAPAETIEDSSDKSGGGGTSAGASSSSSDDIYNSII